MKQTTGWCPSCRQQRLFQATTPSHVLHLLLSVITLGIWLIVWLIIGGKTGPYLCTVCGSRMGDVTVPPPRPG